jgi:hypothetical protein
MKKGILCCVAVCIVLLCGTANAGPFGVSKGDGLDKFSGAKEVKPYVYGVKSLPKKHSKFSSFVLFIHPKTGVALLKGVSHDIDNDSYGVDARAAFDDVRKQLDGIYGKSKLADFLLHDSIWKEPRDWLMGVARNERVYQAVWDIESGAVLKDEIKEILLSIGASGGKSWLIIQYEFNNYDEYKALVSTQESESL